MNRRAFTGALAGFAAAVPARTADPAKRTRFYMLETYQLKNGTQAGRMNDWFSQSLLPKLTKIQAAPPIVLEGLLGPRVQQIVLVVGYSSIAEIETTHSKLRADQDLAAARQKLDQGAEPPFEAQTNTLLEAMDFSPELAAEKRDKPRVFEMRTYHSPTDSQLRLLRNRLGGPSQVVFRKFGIRPILYGTTLAGTTMPSLTYLIPYESLAEREKAWDGLNADADWIKARTESVEKGGQILSVSEVTFYRATAYSPVK